MPEILEDLSTDVLARAIEENLYAWIPFLGRLGRVIEDDPPGVKRSSVNIPMGLLNSVMDVHLTPEQVDAAIERVQADAKERQVPILWWTGPSTHPADLEKHLIKYGFVEDEAGLGMAVQLDKLNESLPKPEGCSIRQALDGEAFRLWAAVLAGGFETPPERIETAANAWHDLLCAADPGLVKPYIAWWNGEPVATSLLFLAAGVAGIYAVATVPKARRHGIGAQVTLYPLLQARAMGFRAGVLGASEMGEKMYRSLGFEEFCRTCSYFWRLPEQLNRST